MLFSTAIAVVYAVWTIRSGVRLAVDTPTYSRWADVLIGLGFNFSAYLGNQDFVAPPIFYLLWITVVAALKTVLGSSWMTGVVVAQLDRAQPRRLRDHRVDPAAHAIGREHVAGDRPAARRRRPS